MRLYDQVWQIPGYCADGRDRAREVLQPITDACLTRGWTVLDVGCGRGHVVHHLHAHGIRALGIDPALPEPGAHLLRGDLRSLVRFACADVVTCFDVLEHLQLEQAEHLLGAMRAISPRICLAIANMEDPHEVPGLGRVELHVTRLDPHIWLDIIAAAGFDHLRLQALPYPERFFVWGGSW
jgi:hypothetical protein